jgi:signal transduction histidine kinase/DNA-binding NarL/FixJ family response regulator
MEQTMKKSLKKFVFMIAVLMSALSIGAHQDVYCQRGGIKFHSYYEDYDRLRYCHHIQQNKQGIVYAVCMGPLLEFDGISWRTIDLNKPDLRLRSMAIDEKGTIYVGGLNEMGYLAPDSKGVLRYVSLVNRLEFDHREFGSVKRIHPAKEGVYFTTLKFLFRWDGAKQFKVLLTWDLKKEHKAWKRRRKIATEIEDPSPIETFWCDGKLFVRREDVGLMKLEKDSLKLIPGGERFASTDIYMMAPCESQKLLIGTALNGFYLYDGFTTVPFPTEADDYLKEKHLYQGIRLKSSKGDFALATRYGGLVIIDSHGRLKHIFNKNYGIKDDRVWYVFEDFQGNLWLGLDKGILKIEYASPITIFDERSGLPTGHCSVTRHHNILYAANQNGLFYLAPTGKFRPVSGIVFKDTLPIPLLSTKLLSTGDSLLVATAKGVFRIENNFKRKVFEKPIRLSRMRPRYELVHSKRDPRRIWVGTWRGLFSLYSKDGLWTVESKIENVTFNVRYISRIIEDGEGNLWLRDSFRGIIKIDFPGDGTINNPVVTRYDESNGLPTIHVSINMAAGHVMFTASRGFENKTIGGIFRFDEKAKAFLPDHTLGDEFAGGEKGKNVYSIKEDKNKNIFCSSNRRHFMAVPRPDGSFDIHTEPFIRISRPPIYVTYFEDDGHNIWFANSENLIRFDTAVKKNYKCDFHTIIRKVLANGELVFGGHKTNVDNNSKSERVFPRLDHYNRSVRFEFSAPFFEDEKKTRYRYLLEGYDSDWSDWTSETQKEYTNLSPGFYTFRVRSKNVYGHPGSEAVFDFKILTPWYLTWWAFLLYAGIFYLMTFFVMKWRRSIQLEKEKHTLEQTIKDRTKELKKKNLQLEEQSEKLKEMDKVKSRFFANISHEFRTPLTLIMGPLEQMLAADGEEKKEREKKLNLMLRNSRRLLGLIDQLLELSKFSTGNIKLHAVRQSIILFIKGILASFEPVTDKNELDLKFQSGDDDIDLYFDPVKLEDVIFNLLSNAVKFTPPGGRITVTVRRNGTQDENFPSGMVEISVSDTGPGIPREQLEYIFDRFYQSHNTYKHHHKGSGIGLAIAKEIVILHHGRIDVHSTEGKGTEFIVRLPIGKGHLKPGEIVEFSEIRPNGKRNGDSLELLVKKEENGERATSFDIDPDKNIILVVEDSADVRDFIRGALEPLYRVVEASNGVEGIRKAQETVPDLIVSDIMMPEADGYELCRQLRNHMETSHIPIILLTAKASEENVMEGFETGADDYITKPFSTKILCARIKNLIDLRSHMQQKVQREMRLKPTKISVSQMEKKFFKKLAGVLKENISDPDFNTGKLCEIMNMSNPTLYRKIRALSGESPTEFIRSYRLKRGAELLKNNFGTVLEVSFEVGFSSTSYFSKCFKEKFDQSPSAYK